jgi:short subunit dehydrogenase-like uncharacterized protein
MAYMSAEVVFQRKHQARSAPTSTTKMAHLMIYGAGYTGELACSHAKFIGLEFVLAGRSAAAITKLASSLSSPHRVFDLENIVDVDAALSDIRVLLNCAGPFAKTAKPLMEACIRNGVHYLDISAELQSYHLAEASSETAAAANVMLLPGCGGSVAMLGCLVGRALKTGESPVGMTIDVALRVVGSMSRGSVISAAQNMTTQTMQLLDGVLTAIDVGDTKKFDFDNGKGEVECFPITLPDLITVGKSSGIGAIRTFVHASDAIFPTGDLNSMPDGPTAQEREASPYDAAVTVTKADGSVRHAVLHTVNGYTFAAVASVEAAKRVLGGMFVAGFQTPVQVFGRDFAGTVANTIVKVL